MAVRTCLITAAGLGTRMGEIGKVLPKPLWNIFNKTLLDLQLDYVRELGIENIYINVHHGRHNVKEWARDKDVKILEEKQLLGSGGCVHNLKKFCDNEIILIVNSDQFFFFDQCFWKKSIEVMERYKACLFAIKVGKDKKYNETVVKNNTLQLIQPSDGTKEYLTYSGVGLLNLGEIDYKDGESSFFDSVCDYKNSEIYMHAPDDFEFWDYGTKELYFENIFKVLEKEDTLLYKFLLRNKAIQVEQKNNDVLEFGDFLLDRKAKKITWSGVKPFLSLFL